MGREYSTAKEIYKRYVIDDGWSENMPMEIIEVIELHIQIARKEAKDRVREANENHKGDWLNAEIAKKYSERAWEYLNNSSHQYIGKVRELGEELQEKYGVTEIEAFNILRNYNVGDYVRKYYLIQNLIPLGISEELIWNETAADLRLAM